MLQIGDVRAEVTFDGFQTDGMVRAQASSFVQIGQYVELILAEAAGHYAHLISLKGYLSSRLILSTKVG